MTVDKRLLRVREKIRRSRPKFRRQESWRYKRLNTGWRKPIGIDNSMRHHKRGIPTIVRVGFRGPKATRGLTRTGKIEVLIHNTYDLEKIEKETQVARIASSVGTRKKVAITNKADELEIKIINRPEEALTFATISEISEELLLEEEDKKEPKEKAPRKKKPSTSSLTQKELEELEIIEAELAGKPTPRKKTPTKKPTTKKPATKTTTKKSTKAPKKTTSKKTSASTKKTSSSKSTGTKSTSSKKSK
ncbi:MAG: 50S ribosomal protein L32e [Candidatus Heimdallarchaeota archaeon]|nr:MAG: 50S ribosomal protein L32e [Candidatus Heimdallarchaeota archaeon]